VGRTAHVALHVVDKLAVDGTTLLLLLVQLVDLNIVGVATGQLLVAERVDVE
jgi:hypothetical protein